MRRQSIAEFTQTWHWVALHLMTRVTIYDLKFSNHGSRILCLVFHQSAQYWSLMRTNNLNRLRKIHHQQFMQPGKIFFNSFLKEYYPDLSRGAGLHGGELLVSLGVPELVQRHIENHQQLEAASEGERQSLVWSVSTVLRDGQLVMTSIVPALKELGADISKVSYTTHWHIGWRLEARIDKSTFWFPVWQVRQLFVIVLIEFKMFSETLTIFTWWARWRHCGPSPPWASRTLSRSSAACSVSRRRCNEWHYSEKSQTETLFT